MPAVEQFPVYQDVRVKSVRILGLQEGDTVEYRVITTTEASAGTGFLAGTYFDRSGQVLEEHYELDLADFAESGATHQSRGSARIERKYGDRRKCLYDLPLEAHIFARRKMARQARSLTGCRDNAGRGCFNVHVGATVCAAGGVAASGLRAAGGNPCSRRVE